MGFDNHHNFAYTTVATAPSTPTAGVSFTILAGTTSRLPETPFQATVWPINTIPTPLNAEVIRVTGISSDTLLVTRAQESSTARAILVGDQLAATITAKNLTDYEVAFPPIGAIIAWLKSTTGVPALPAGWVECNGGNVSNVNSPINGQPIPDLNTTNLFLRGNSTSSSTGGAGTHTHDFDVNSNATTDTIDVDALTPNATVASAGHAHEVIGTTTSVNNLPPYMDIVWILRII